MKQDLSGSTVAPLPNSVRAEAAVWVARLHSSGRSRALESGLRKWLKADPAHTRAFELATEAWEIGGGIPGGALPRMADPFVDRQPGRFSRRSYFAVAAALSAVIVGATVFLSRSTPAVSTTVGEQRMLTLDDGTRIFLNTDTTLFVKEDATHRHVSLDTGEALFDVAKDPQRPFVVTAGDKEVVALGTSFVVRRDPRQLVVTLVEGRLRVTAGGLKKETVLKSGQRLTFSERKPASIDEPPIDEVIAWRRGEIILDKTRLRDAVEEMNRYSAVKLVLDDPAAAEIRVSGIFRAGDSVRFAQAVGEAYHLSVDHEQRRIVISDSPD
ncbi:MAG: FecR domain-containing protein [Gammaproteobacteria bacterium]